MPYVNRYDRALLDACSGSIHFSPSVSPGFLNYLVTKLTIAFVGEAPNYARFNAAIGALECAKLELYRRMVAPYEDQKIAENGDVYP